MEVTHEHGIVVRAVRLALALLLCGPWRSALAQSDSELALRLIRNFGYREGDRIQGRFTLEVVAGENLLEAAFLMDGEVFDRRIEPPFRTSFSTGDYPLGAHSFQAVGVDTSGRQLQSPVVTVTFISAEESWQVAGRLSSFILGGVVALMLVGMAATALLSRGKRRFELGVYGLAGGAVCSRCQLPFSRQVLSPNLLFGKLERCPHCGRLAILPRASRSALDEAEERYRQDRARGQREINEQRDGFQQRLEDSRFEH